MKYMKLTPQTIGTENMSNYILSKFEKLKEYKQKLNKNYDECIKTIENSINLNKPKLNFYLLKGDYTYYEILENHNLLFFQSKSTIKIEGKMFMNEQQKIILSVKNNISNQLIEKYIEMLHKEYSEIYEKELENFNKNYRTI